MRAEALRTSGRYSNPHSTHAKVYSYDALRKAAVRKRDYYEAAYIDGYLNGLLLLDMENDDAAFLPLFFVWGSNNEMLEFNAFRQELHRASELHKGAAAQAQRMAAGSGDGLILRHPPFLNTKIE